MKLIIGLGNPGKKYANTRHNIGQMIVDKLPNLPQTIITQTDTFMNESGIFVERLVHYYKVNLNDLYLIHDDLDLPVGEYRLQFDRGPAGHHGVESIIQHLNSQAFWRVRVGIDHPLDNIPVEDYVLKPFTVGEKVLISEVIDKIIKELEEILGH